MVVNGSSGERYSLNKKKRHTGRTYTEYPIMGSGGYIARIYDRKLRKAMIEAEVKEAVFTGNYYEDEQPLNVLYSRNKFIGYLYKGEFEYEIASNNEETELADADNVYRQSNHIDSELFVIALQIAAGIVATAIGWFIVYPAYQRTIDSHMTEFSSFVRDLTQLNYKGIPAILVGIILQIVVLIKGSRFLKSPVIMTTASLISNLLGCAVFTLLLTVIVFLIHGAITFVMKYLAVIILLLVGFIWLKGKFRFR